MKSRQQVYQFLLESIAIKVDVDLDWQDWMAPYVQETALRATSALSNRQLSKIYQSDDIPDWLANHVQPYLVDMYNKMNPYSTKRDLLAAMGYTYGGEA